jgi:hypothetical protein
MPRNISGERGVYGEAAHQDHYVALSADGAEEIG